MHVIFIYNFFVSSNTDVPPPIMQSLKKQCNPTMTKSFKERNPDLDMDEIQNNPNIPDDIKAALSGAVLDTGEEEMAEGELTDAVGVSDTSVEALLFEKYDDLFMDESDEERKKSRKSKKHEDDEWFATVKARKEKERKKMGPRPRGRPKRKSDEGTSGGDGSSEKPEKVRKKAIKKRPSEENRTDSSTDGTPVTKIKTEPRAKGTPKKQPPVLPFSLLDLTKKFEGKIPNIKQEIKEGTTIAAATTIACTSTSSSGIYNQAKIGETKPSQSIAAMLSAGPGKHERKQDKTQIWRNNSNQLSAVVSPQPSKIYMKPAITYPNPNSLGRENGQTIIKGDASLSSLISTTNGSYFDGSGSKAAPQKTSKYFNICI